MRFVARCFVPSDFAISSDHRPVVCELNFRPRVAPKPSASPPMLNIHALNDDAIKVAFQSEVEHLIGNANPEEVTSEELASSIRSAAVSAASKVIPVRQRSKFPR